MLDLPCALITGSGKSFLLRQLIKVPLDMLYRFSNGRHTRGKGYLGDMEKYNSAQELGYQVYRYSTEQVKSGKAIDEILKRIG